MAKTFLQRNLSYYERLIEEAKKSPFASNYQKVCDELEGLVKITNKLRGTKHKMSPIEYENLTNSYKAVQTACEQYSKEKDKFGDFEKKRYGIVTDISSVVKKDLDVLLKCNPLEPESLSEIMEKSRVHKIIINKDHIKRAGAAQSSRIPIETKSGKKGFFTPTSYFNQDKEWAKGLKPFEEYFGTASDECKKKMEMLKNNEAFQKEFSRFVQCERMEYNESNFGEARNNLIHLAFLLGIRDNQADVAKLYDGNREFRRTLVDFTNSVRDLANRQRIMNSTGIKKGDNISSRNCAMTAMAKMLKCRNLLANSVPMKIEIDGEEIEGVFMENAEGSDINHLKEGDLLLSAKGPSFQNPDVLHQLLDLQVLDFICGNTDRHRGNMLYKFKEEKPGKVMLVGIQGIDNDCSFGTPKVNNYKNIMQMTHPVNMKFISKPMLLNLNLMTKERVQLNLAHYNLSNDQIEAAWDRVQMVKNAVEKGLIQTIDKDYWKKNSIGRVRYENNYIAKIQEMAKKCHQEDYYANESEKKKIEYAKEMSSSATEIMMKNVEKIAELRVKMNDAKAMIFDSSEYKLMAEQFEKIEKITNDINKNHPGLKDIPEEKTNALREAYIQLAENTDKYIALKSLVPSTTRGEKRLDFAKGLRNIANDTLEDLGFNTYKEKMDEEIEVEKEDDMAL